MEEAVRAVLAVWERGAQSGDGAGQIHFEQREGFVVRETSPEFINILCGRRIGGEIPGCAIEGRGTWRRALGTEVVLRGHASPSREDILEEWNRLDLIDVCIVGSRLREHCAGLKIRHFACRIGQI